MTTNTTVKVLTKLNKDQAQGIETQLTIDWDASAEQMQELAKRSIVIQYQSLCRAAGKVPTTDTIKVSELFIKRARVSKTQTPEDIVAAARANPELLAQIKALLEAK